MSDTEVKIRISGDSTQAVAAFNRAREGATKLRETYESLKGAVIAFGATLAVAAMNEAVQRTAEYTEQSMDLGRALGSSAGEASVFKAALDDVGSTQEEFSTAAGALGKNLRNNEDRLQALGLKTRDASGQLRPMNELMLDAVEVINSYKEGTDRNLAAQEIFGKSVDGSSKLLLLNKQTLDDNRQAVEELGLIVGDKSVTAWNEFDAAGDRAQLSMKGITKAVGDQLMPAVTDLLNLFNEAAPTAIRVLRGALGGLMTAFYGLQNGIVIVGEVVMATLYTITEPIRALGSGLWKLLHGDFKGAEEELSNWPTRIGNAWQAGWDKIVASSSAARERITNLFTDDTASAPTPGAGQGRGYVAKPDAAAEAERRRAAREAEKLRRQQFEDSIATQRLELQQYNNNMEERLRIARRIADQVKAFYGEGSKEHAAALAEIVRIEQRAAQQRQQIQQTLAASETSARLAQVEEERADADLSLALGQITAEQRLEQERAFQERMHEIKRQALQARLQLLEKDPDSNPVERARINAEIEELQRQHQANLAGITRQEKGLQADPANNPWARLAQQAGDATEGILTRQRTALQALQDLWKGAFNIFLQEMITKPLTQWLMKEAVQTGATTAGVATRTAVEAAGAATSLATMAGTVVKTIGMKAWETAASVYAAIAAIPVVGPFMAPALAIGAMGAVMAFAGNVFSASGGFDIPAGVNPLVQAHAREMILPAKHADVIRSLADRGGMGGAAGGTLQLHVQALDARSFERYLNGPGGDGLVRAIQMRQRSRRA
ncbi:MAG: hypothetical protein ACOZD0_04600 [Pseudomonadota bacterium]